MIGLDTNVLVRYLTQDDARQAAVATRVIERDLTEETPGFIGTVVLVETTWVLQRLYSASPAEILETVSGLLGTRTIVLENRNVIARAVSTCEANGGSFADAVIAAAATSAGCTKTVTFDRGAVSTGMTLLR